MNVTIESRLGPKRRRKQVALLPHPFKQCDCGELPPHRALLRVNMTLDEYHVWKVITFWLDVLLSVIRTERKQVARLEEENKRLHKVVALLARDGDRL